MLDKIYTGSVIWPPPPSLGGQGWKPQSGGGEGLSSFNLFKGVECQYHCPNCFIRVSKKEKVFYEDFDPTLPVGFRPLLIEEGSWGEEWEYKLAEAVFWVAAGEGSDDSCKGLGETEHRLLIFSRIFKRISVSYANIPEWINRPIFAKLCKQTMWKPCLNKTLQNKRIMQQYIHF